MVTRPRMASCDYNHAKTQIKQSLFTKRDLCHLLSLRLAALPCPKPINARRRLTDARDSQNTTLVYLAVLLTVKQLRAAA